MNYETSSVLNGSIAPQPLTVDSVPFEYRLFTKPQMAAYFDVEIRTLESWMKKGILRLTKIGRNVRFQGADIIATLNAQRHAPRRRGRLDSE